MQNLSRRIPVEGSQKLRWRSESCSPPSFLPLDVTGGEQHMFSHSEQLPIPPIPNPHHVSSFKPFYSLIFISPLAAVELLASTVFFFFFGWLIAVLALTHHKHYCVKRLQVNSWCCYFWVISSVGRGDVDKVGNEW